MSTGDPFQQLELQLARWREALEALRCTVTEDRPAANDVALADCYDDATTDALAWLNEACREARRLTRLNGGDGAVRALFLVHGRVNELARQHSTALAGWERVLGLAELGARRGRQWQQWATVLHAALAALPETIFITQQLLAECWRELAGQPRGFAAELISSNQN